MSTVLLIISKIKAENILKSQQQVAHIIRVVNLSFLDRSHYFSFKKLLIYPQEAEWTLFQPHCYTENLVVPGIEPRTYLLAPRNS
jgi:hypothetical protein